MARHALMYRFLKALNQRNLIDGLAVISGWVRRFCRRTHYHLTMKTLIAFSLVACSFMLAFLIRGSFKISSAQTHAALDLSRFNPGTESNAATLEFIPVPEDLDFAGEKIPWDIRAVRERYAAEQKADAYWMVPGLLLEQDRNERYYQIKRILREEKVPTDFVYLFMAESTLRNRVSHKGAAGVCQMMPEAAKTFGLEVNGEVDERYHYTKSIRAACQYLKKSHQLLGSWTMAAAAYNHGYNGMLRKKKDHPEKSYFEIPLNPETSRYLYRIICIKEAMENPGKYGYAIKRQPQPHKTYTVTVNSSIPSLSDFAEQHGSDLIQLKKHNPWLVWNRLTNVENKTYYITLPVAEVIENPLTADVIIPAAANDTQSLGNIVQRLFN